MENKSTKQPHALTLDVEKYEHYLANADMTEAEKQEFLQALWDIIVSFVDMGFGIEPTQTACGQMIETCESAQITTQNALESSHTKLHDDEEIASDEAQIGAPA